MTRTLTFLFVLFSFSSLAQTNLDLAYEEIPPSYDDYGSGNILSRLVDGLGYRYYWATEGLLTNDLNYKPTPESRTAKQTLEHILGLSETIVNAAKNEANIRPADWSELSFEELRESTLANLKAASELYQGMTAVDIAKLQVKFESNGNTNAFPFWNMINGPMADAIYHTGQIVTLRRSSGNPINPKVNVFIGKTGK